MADLLEKIEDGVATLTLNRPERLNALSGDITSGLQEAVPRLMADSEVGCIVITGAGRGFCAGGDVKGFAEGNSKEPQAGKSYRGTLEQSADMLMPSMRMVGQLHTGPKPTIAMMRGPAAGAGLSIALACDIRIASDTLKCTTAFANIGGSGDFGGSYFLPKYVGAAKARELYLTAAIVEAEEALRIGLVNHVVPDAELEERTMEMARKFARGPGIAYQYIKQNFNMANTASMEQVFEAEAIHMARCLETDDHKEAARAFVEKRAPEFKGT